MRNGDEDDDVVDEDDGFVDVDETFRQATLLAEPTPF